MFQDTENRAERQVGRGSSEPNQSRLISPLRYPGSKRRLAAYVSQALRINELRLNLYVEAFAGGASVALQLLAEGLVNQVLLIDRDPYIASFWKSVFFDTDWLVEQIETIDVTLEQWNLFKNQEPSDTREFALACLFLNRTSFSGILANGAGPIGGRSQASKYSIDCRFPRPTLSRRIRQAAEFRDNIYGVWDCSWDYGIQQIRDLQNSQRLPADEVFFYFDPPFFEKADRLYRYYFKQDDHERFRDFLLTLQDKWLLSYDSADQVEMLYGAAIRGGINGTQQRRVELLYSTSITPGSRPGQEIILSNLPRLPPQTRLWTANGK